MKRLVIRVSIAKSRFTEVMRELTDYGVGVGAGHPYIQGTSSDLLWDFTGPSQLERSQLFLVNLPHTPGILSISGPYPA